MTTPKRVWSNKKTVWEWKKWVWKVWDEIATYDGTWSKAEWQLTVYGNSWENLSWDDKLEVYDSSSATEIGTVDENQGGWDVPCTSIWIVDHSWWHLYIDETKLIGYARPEPVNCKVNLEPYSASAFDQAVSITIWEKDENWYPIYATWLSEGHGIGIQIKDTLTNVISSNWISLEVSWIEGWVEIDVNQSDLAPTVWNNWTIKLNNMPWAFTISWSPEWVCSTSEIDQANSSVIYTTEATWDCTFTITDNTDNRNTASCAISVHPVPLAVPSLIFDNSEEGHENEGWTDVSYYPPDQGAEAYWYISSPLLFKLEGLDPSVEDAETRITIQTTEGALLDFVAEPSEDTDRPYQITGTTQIDQLVFTNEQDMVACNVIWNDWDAGTETVIWTLNLTVSIPEITHHNDDQNIQLTNDGDNYTWSWLFLPLTIDTNMAPVLYYYDEAVGEWQEAYVGSVQIVANEDSSTMSDYPYVLEVSIPTSDVTPPTWNNYYYVQIQRTPWGDSYLTLNGMFMLQFPSS